MTTSRYLVSVCFALACSASVRAAEMSAADLLYRVGDAAAVEARDAQDAAAAGAQAAQQWRQWAVRYWGNAQVLQSNIEYSRRAAHQAAAIGHEPAARFYDASDKFWTDIARQMAAGQRPAVRFPKREMLTPIPGLPGTPWENMEQPEAQQQQQPPPRQPQPGQQGGQRPASNDPMPRPNYGWIHGSRYTATAMAELAAWARRQKHLTPEQQNGIIQRARQNNEDDERREQQWIKSTIGGGR